MAQMSKTQRWRTFADAIAIALGTNLWVSLVLLPGLVVGAFSTPLLLATLLLPLPLLFAGVWARNEVLLLFGFPTSLLIPIAMRPEMASMQVYGVARFLIVGISLVVFLFGASTLTSFYEAPPPRRIRPLKSASQSMPPRWKRRFRMYAVLSVISVLYPLALLYHVNFDEAGALTLNEKYPGRASTFTTLLNAFAIGLWLLLFSFFILAPLKKHRTGDKDLQIQIANSLKKASRGRPHPLFYFAGLAAVGLMTLWFLWQR